MAKVKYKKGDLLVSAVNDSFYCVLNIANKSRFHVMNEAKDGLSPTYEVVFFYGGPRPHHTEERFLEEMPHFIKTRKSLFLDSNDYEIFKRKGNDGEQDIIYMVTDHDQILDFPSSTESKVPYLYKREFKDMADFVNNDFIAFSNAVPFKGIIELNNE
jgi:hypothetical protein